jgi:uncharacterized protein (DUF433 family)
VAPRETSGAVNELSSGAELVGFLVPRRMRRDSQGRWPSSNLKLASGSPGWAIFPVIVVGRHAGRGELWMRFSRITVNPDQIGGGPCIRGLRIPVATVVGMLADEMTPAEILAAYPDLEAGDVREALLFAAETVRERELPLVMVP